MPAYTPITPASLDFLPDGTPTSPEYGDVYHTTAGGPGQAKHVFLHGNGLPARWRGWRRFVILETGFGAGLNFLATWAAWQADSARCPHLHFISTELHPLRREDLARIHAAFPAHWQALAAELRAQWPPLAAGLHRLHLAGGALTLDLYLADTADALAELDCAADAFYLDGFSPTKNPEMWSPRIAHLLARRAATGATLATWSVSRAVRDALQHAGFACEKAPGYGGKRDMLRGHIRDTVRPATPAHPEPHDRHALIIGTGLAGSHLAARLAAKGWQVDVFDAADHPAAGASGNHAGALRPLPSLDDNRLSQLTRAGSLYGWRHIDTLSAAGHDIWHARCGVLHLSRDDAQETKMRTVVDRLALPPELLRYADRDTAAHLAGHPVPNGGWHFPHAGWVSPPTLCRANLAASLAIRTHLNAPVTALHHDGQHWHLRTAHGDTHHACHLVLAAGIGTPALLTTLPAAPPLPIVPARGQVSLSAQTTTAPRLVVCRQGYVTPAVHSLYCFGATFHAHDPDPTVRPQDHLENLQKLAAIFPHTPAPAPDTLQGRTSFRPASPDRLPMLGPLPGTAPGLWALTGYGARGLVWSALLAETLASLMDAAPTPLPLRLLHALNPARFAATPAA